MASRPSLDGDSRENHTLVPCRRAGVPNSGEAASPSVWAARAARAADAPHHLDNGLSTDDDEDEAYDGAGGGDGRPCAADSASASLPALCEPRRAREACGRRRRWRCIPESVALRVDTMEVTGVLDDWVATQLAAREEKAMGFAAAALQSLKVKSTLGTAVTAKGALVGLCGVGAPRDEDCGDVREVLRMTVLR